MNLSRVELKKVFRRLLTGIGGALRWTLLPKARKKLFLEVIFELFRARYQIFHRPFKEVAVQLGRLGVETPAVTLSDDGFSALAAGYVKRLAPWMPFESLCFVQALALGRVLLRRNYQITIYLGLNRSQAEMKAHAWLRWGDQVLAGGPQHLEYTVVGCFTNAPNAKPHPALSHSRNQVASPCKQTS